MLTPGLFFLGFRSSSTIPRRLHIPLVTRSFDPLFQNLLDPERGVAALRVVLLEGNAFSLKTFFPFSWLPSFRPAPNCFVYTGFHQV